MKTLGDLIKIAWVWSLIAGVVLSIAAMWLGVLLVVLFVADSILFGEATLSASVMDGIIWALDRLGDLLFSWVP